MRSADTLSANCLQKLRYNRSKFIIIIMPFDIIMNIILFLWVDQNWTDMSHYQKMVFCQIKLQLNLSCMQFCRIQTFYICLSAVDKMKFMSHFFFYFYCRKLGSNQYLNLTRNSFLPVKLLRLLIASGENRTPMFTSSM